jgi:hypothetical protein
MEPSAVHASCRHQLCRPYLFIHILIWATGLQAVKTARRVLSPRESNGRGLPVRRECVNHRGVGAAGVRGDVVLVEADEPGERDVEGVRQVGQDVEGGVDAAVLECADVAGVRVDAVAELLVGEPRWVRSSWTARPRQACAVVIRGLWIPCVCMGGLLLCRARGCCCTRRADLFSCLESQQLKGRRGRRDDLQHTCSRTAGHQDRTHAGAITNT